MAKKILYSILAGMLVMAVAGPAAAGSSGQRVDDHRGLTYTEIPAQQPTADPEWQFSNSEPWLVRGPVETGSMPSAQGFTPELRCCAGDSGPMLDKAGDTVLRQGIDDGP